MPFSYLGIFVAAGQEERKRHRKTVKIGYSMPFMCVEMFLVQCLLR